MEMQGKIWGETFCIFRNMHVEVHRIIVKKGGFCSWHLHSKKHNLFYLESGNLDVIIEKSGIMDTTNLRPNAVTTVAPGLKHKFYAHEDSVALEIYWVEMDPNDIERFLPGGAECVS